MNLSLRSTLARTPRNPRPLGHLRARCACACRAVRDRDFSRFKAELAPSPEHRVLSSSAEPHRSQCACPKRQRGYTVAGCGCVQPVGAAIAAHRGGSPRVTTTRGLRRRRQTARATCHRPPTRPHHSIVMSAHELQTCELISQSQRQPSTTSTARARDRGRDKGQRRFR